MEIRKQRLYKLHDPVWLLGDATCEKMGDLMASNGNRLLGLYDELSTFLSQLNLYCGKGLALSHELALFLQLYNGCSWTRNTGNSCGYSDIYQTFPTFQSLEMLTSPWKAQA